MYCSKMLDNLKRVYKLYESILKISLMLVNIDKGNNDKNQIYIKNNKK